jgi:hypothetical protein
MGDETLAEQSECKERQQAVIYSFVDDSPSCDSEALIQATNNIHVVSQLSYSYTTNITATSLKNIKVQLLMYMSRL